MYKLIIIAALVACCLAAPADNNRQNVLYLARPGYYRQNVPVFVSRPRAESIESEEWGVDKREVSETEPVPEVAGTTENPDLERIRQVNALAYIHPATVSRPVLVSSLL